MTVINISGYDVMIDDKDVARVTSIKWHVNKRNLNKYGLFYFEHLFRNKDSDGNTTRHVASLHRFIMGRLHGDKSVVDHIDCNTLNNQKHNMRVCTNRENSCNQRLSSMNKSGYKGVSYNRRDKRWYATIRVRGRTIHIGCFLDPKIAHDAWKIAAKKYNGSFARFE